MKKRYTTLLVLGLLVGGIFTIAYSTLPSLPDMTPFKEKAHAYNVDVIRDEWGIPHIFGKKDKDTAFGLGYAHAEDDFATIQDVMLATRGKLAAEKGPKAAKTDYLIQWMGIWEAVAQGYDTLPEHTKAIAEAYADGLNLYAAENPDKVSPYAFPFKGEDVVAGFTFKTPLFYGFDKELGKLFDTSIPKEIAKEGEQPLVWQPSEHLPVGSQGIAVAPHRSEEGRTHLLINSHQPLTGPVAWYEASLHSEEGWNMAGATFPGAPIIIHGHNEHLGWANTVNKPDLTDIYVLKINPENDQQYWMDGAWHNFEMKEASMTVKLFGPLRWTVKKDILIAAHGPVMETEEGYFAINWAGRGETRQLDFMYRLNKASNFEEFEEAMRMQAMPSINYVYADKEGNIAHFYNAQFPHRIEGWDWKKYLPGDRSELIWNTYRPYQDTPKTVNPTTGLVYNANNPPFQATDGNDDPKSQDFPPSMGIESFVTNRALQIETLYGLEDKISSKEFEQFKYDLSYHPASTQAKRLREWLSQPIPEVWKGTVYEKAFLHLQSWDLSTHLDNTAAALGVLTLAPIQQAQGKKVSSEVIQEAFVQAVDQLEEHYNTYAPTYGQVNRHVRGEVSLPISGGPDILRAVYGGPLNEDGQLHNRAGDSYIMMVEWDSNGVISSKAIHNYGTATLDPTSPHYSDQANLFVQEKLRPVYRSKEMSLSKGGRQYTPGKESTITEMEAGL
ncbi:penicillin acylase family protein [Algivirga pacifica]|uniref:Acylase n=1 Tax=Algivirga pacifica TaxID=1162670 RepID=A0ABP9DN68_9BACT